MTTAEMSCHKCGDPNALPAPHTGMRLCDACFMGLLTNQKPTVSVGSPVLYHQADGSTVLGVVTAIAEHDGDCDIDLGDPAVKALDVKMGQGPHTFEPLDAPADWTIVYCPDDGHRWPSFFAVCPVCKSELPDA